MTNLNALPAPGNVLEGLSKLGSAIVGLSAFAYIAGLVKLTSMYTTINAGWLTEFLVTQDIIRAGLGPLAMVGVAAVATIYVYSSKGWVYAKLLTLLAASLVVVYVSLMPSNIVAQDWFKDYRFSELISNSLYLISGVIVSCSVVEFVLNKRFNKLIASGFLIGSLCALYVTPMYLGRVWAHSVVSGDLKLGRVVSEQHKNGSCYLLGNINSKYLIGCVSSGRVNQVKMMDVDKDIAFE